ncbi:hypothetical protein Tco_0915926 [Tanacetum coccineum]
MAVWYNHYGSKAAVCSHNPNLVNSVITELTGLTQLSQPVITEDKKGADDVVFMFEMKVMLQWLHRVNEEGNRSDVEQVKTMKIQAGIQVSRPRELARQLHLWKRFGRLYLIVFVLVRNINEYNLISWSLCDFCGVHILLMQNGIAIHMLTEKKYPLSQEMISKMLSKRLEVDQESTQAYELLKFIRSQGRIVGNKSSSRVNTAKVPIPVTTPPETGTSTTIKMTLPATIEEKTCKKNDVKARSLLLMALPNEHQLTFDQYVDAQSMFAAIKARFGGNEATKKTQKALLKQQSLPSEWDTHVVVWMNKPDFDTMGLDDLYNNFKIVEQKVKKSAGASNDDKNLAFVTTSGASSTNNINTVNPEVSTATTKVNTASTEICTASISDATVYAFLSTQPKGSQLVHEDLEQLHDDDLEEMDLKWNMALLSMRARKFYQRTGRKIIIDGSNTAGYDKSKTVKIEDASEKAMCAIDGADFDWSDMAEEEIQANMALMAFSDSEVKNDKSCSKNCLKNYEALKKQYDDLLVKLSDTDFKAATYKREHEILFSEEIALLKRSVGCKEYELGLLRTELEKLKQEKEGVDFKIAKFDKFAKDLNEMLESQQKQERSLEEFKEPEVNEYDPRDSSLKPTGCDKESDNSKENIDDSLEQHQMTDTETSSFESPLKVDKD